MIQPDLISCGLFTLNAIGHYYLPQDIPLLQPDPSSLACYRLEIALELLQAGAVSLLLFKNMSYTIITNQKW